MYVATMLGSPLFQILFFTYLGRYAGSEDDAFFIVGNAIQVAAMAGIYGMTMGIANERQFGTLQQLLATPANRLAIFSGRALPFIANGLVVSAFGFAVSSPARLPARGGERRRSPSPCSSRPAPVSPSGCSSARSAFAPVTSSSARTSSTS
jgi:hypothetical protein